MVRSSSPVPDKGQGQPSMKRHYAPYEAELGRLDQGRMRHSHRVQRPFELATPEVEEAGQDGKFGSEIVVLPDEVLQELRVVGKAVQDVGCRQAVAFKLFDEIF